MTTIDMLSFQNATAAHYFPLSGVVEKKYVGIGRDVSNELWISLRDLHVVAIVELFAASFKG